MATTKFSLQVLTPELKTVMNSRELVSANLTLSEAYLLMQACQLTATHPKLSEPMIDRFEALGRRMQELVRPHVSDFFAEFCDAGWHRECDA